MGAGTFAIGALSSVAGFEQQQVNADRQNQYAQENYVNTVNAVTSTYAGALTQQNQEKAGADQQLLQDEIGGAQAKGAAITAGGQAGVDGSAALSATLQNFDAQQGRQDSAVQTNYATALNQTNQGLQAAQTGSQARVNAVPQAVAPSLFSAGLGIAGAGFQGAATYERDSYLSHPWSQPMNAGMTQAASSY